MIGDESTIFNAALAMLDLGWAPLPLAPQSKRPIRPYRTWTGPADEETVVSWFDGQEREIGVVLGNPSGGLICRDFDSEDVYSDWRESNKTLADTAPTSKTSRGHHVFVYGDVDQVRDASSTGKSLTIHGRQGHGELKANGYAVLPPSRHVSGQISYTWTIPPWDDVPYVSDLYRAGLVPPPKSNRKPKSDKTPAATEGRFTQEIYRGMGGPLGDRLQEAIRRTLPTGIGQRRDCLFNFVRILKSFPEYRDSRPEHLKSEFEQWFLRAYPIIRTKRFRESWKDFLSLWDYTEHPAGETIAGIWRCCTGDGIERVKELCRILQEIAGSEPFNLDCRTVAALIDRSHVTANNWLNRLVADGVLQLVSRHHYRSKTKGQAREFRYMHRGEK